MPTVNTQDNPVVTRQGTKQADTTIIDSDIAGSNVTYQIVTEKTQESFTVSAASTIDTVNRHAQIVAISQSQLKIVLKERTKYKVRVRGNDRSGYGAWARFKTRDKRYQSPDAITQLTDDTDTTSVTTGASGGSRTITVTNSGKGVIATTSGGATVTNSDTQYNDTSSIVFTNAGATVTNNTGTIVFTTAGATIDNT